MQVQQLMARMIKNGPSLEQAMQAVHEINREKGWHENGRTVSDYVALIMTELAEAVEAFRNGHDFNEIHYTVKTSPSILVDLDPSGPAYRGLRKIQEWNGTRGDTEPPTEEEWAALVEVGIAKPEGVAVEFVDALIRILDTLGAEGTNLQHIFDLKMAYNRTRPHRHGGKRL